MNSFSGKKIVSDWFGFYAPRFYALALVLGLIVRIVLIFHPLTVVDWGAGDWLRIFLLGALNDLAFATVALVPAFVAGSFMTDAKYRRPWSYILWGLLAGLTGYVFLFNDITDEYGGPLPRIVKAVLAFFLVCLTLKMLLPRIRRGWRIFAVWAVMMIYAACAVSIAFSEVVFWSEFGVRFNFIAVDYLVYTHEVIGNIMESYPMVPMVLGMLLISGAICLLMARGRDLREAGTAGPGRWALHAVALACGVAVSVLFLRYGYRSLRSENLFATELQQSGCWDFLEAFSSNELDYGQFYLMSDGAGSLCEELCSFGEDGAREIVSEGPELRKNVVLITIESLSGDFLTRYGSERDITPRLDELMEQSLVFDNLFATGNRTVRGLEAVTLCLPPSSGESLVKRPGGGDFFSTGEVLREKGWHTMFIYGGDSYFDNMGPFFSSCGYDVLDRKTYEDITFANIWGTCDEDTYAKALATFDAESGPFFAHIMTISNHRPYTYPEGKIEFDGKAMSRAAAVKYTDYALGAFLYEARGHEWFSNTVFVIMADHCASSAGKTSLPLECYHIPALIWAPGFVEPRYEEKVCSQIDVMPTLFSLLGLSYRSEFFGDDILSDSFRERAFMATYQDLGYYAGGVLTVLSPVRRVEQFLVTSPSPWRYEQIPLEAPGTERLREAQAYYQSANLKYAAPRQ